MRRKPIVVAVVVAGIATAHTAAQNPAGPPDAPTPSPTSPDLDTLVRGNTRFALDLYARLCADAEEGGNVLCAPQSLSTALAMTFAGAGGETAEQMADTLHFDLDGDRLHAAFAALQEARPAGDQARDDPTELTVANRLWGQHGEQFLPEFLDTIATHYGGGLETVDFRAEPDEARRRINAWTEQQTRGWIRELLNRREITPGTVLVLTNAIHFNGTWRTQFDAEQTRSVDFHGGDGRVAPVPMMNVTDRLGYYESELVQAVSLPYAGDRMEMIVLLPAAPDGLAALEDALEVERLSGWIEGMRRRWVAVSLPRFGSSSRFELEEHLAAMGMPLAFSGSADFSGMNGRPHDLFITHVVHQTFVEVDEAGTEAAAAAAVAMERGGAGTPERFVADHPFLYLIRDRGSGSILFMGRVGQPEAEAAAG